MKPPPFRYVRPDSVDEVVRTLAEHGDDAKVLAGGQSLVPLMNFRLARPGVLVDLAAVEELRGIRPGDGHVAVGAMTRQRDAERSSALREMAPLVAQALAWVAHPQIRNRGTVGGSLAHADPAAELPAAALVLDATLVIRGIRGERLVPAAEFFFGPFTTAIGADELLTEVRLPRAPVARSTFVEMARRAGDFAMVGVAAVNRGTTLPDIALAAIGVSGAAVRLTACEDLVRGRALTDDVLEGVASTASQAVDPPTDLHADAAHRRALLGVLVRRAVRIVAAGSA